jgi:hypothetical protein
MLNTLAEALLTAGLAGAPDVTRAYKAGGPQAAKVCEQLIVYPAPVTVEGPGAQGNVPALGCAAVAKPAIILAYTKDCYPMVDQPAGGQPQLPDPAAVDLWTDAYLTTCWAILDAVLDAHLAGTLGDCSSVTVGPVVWTGPTGGTCTMAIPVTTAGT